MAEKIILIFDIFYIFCWYDQNVLKRAAKNNVRNVILLFIDITLNIDHKPLLFLEHNSDRIYKDLQITKLFFAAVIIYQMIPSECTDNNYRWLCVISPMKIQSIISNLNKNQKELLYIEKLNSRNNFLLTIKVYFRKNTKMWSLFIVLREILSSCNICNKSTEYY